jgi:putative toxin-antitoxin system antitoxin component (TIGR02293 family)
MSKRESSTSRRKSEPRGQAGDLDVAMRQAVEFLGGKQVFPDLPRNRTELHSAILIGIPGAALGRMVSNVSRLTAEQVGEAVGVTTRTMHRRKEAPEAPLSADQGGRALRFAELLSRACLVFGSQEQAEQWFNEAQMGLDQKRPIELITTVVGAQLVDELLGRLEYGVYT